jgi:hypothetical protein
MNKTNGIVIALLIILIGLVGYSVFSGPSTVNNIITPGNQIIPEPQLNNPIDSTTGLVYPNGFSVVPSERSLVLFVKGNDSISIEEKYKDAPKCDEFWNQEESFGFCVKGYHGEASSDEVANLFINLNK